MLIDMQQLDQNKQTLYYAKYLGNVPVYAHDDEGNIITQEIDGEVVNVVESTKDSYSAPTEFEANISFNTGESQLAEYGLNTSDYNAIISTNKGEFDFDEQTLIWHKSQPRYNEDESVQPESADYRVVAVKTSVGEERFILKKRVDDE